jgi:hypothetical protein
MSKPRFFKVAFPLVCAFMLGAFVLGASGCSGDGGTNDNTNSNGNGNANQNTNTNHNTNGNQNGDYLQDTCARMIECDMGGSQFSSVQQCIDTMNAMLVNYRQQMGDICADAYETYLRCLGEHTCEQLENGDCNDEAQDVDEACG